MKLISTLMMVVAAVLPLVGGDGITLVDFAAEQPKLELHRPAEKQQKAFYAELPENRAGIRCEWDNSLAGHTEFSVAKRMKLPSFDRAVITVEAYLPPECPVRRFNIRLRDRDGEIFQFVHNVPAGLSGWQRFEYGIDPVKDGLESWGGGKKADKKIDFPASFIGFAADFNSRTGHGWLGVGKVRMQVTSAPPLITLYTGDGSPIHVLKPGGAEPVSIRILNRRPEPVAMKFAYTVSDVMQNCLENKELELNMAAGGAAEIPVGRPDKYGVYYLDLRYRETPEQAPVARRLSYAYMEPAGPTPGKSSGFIFGICTHLRGKPAADQEREAMAAAWCGAKLARDDISWGRVMPTPESWLFGQYEDFRLILEKQHIELAPILQYPPRWSRAEDWVPIRNRGSFRPDYKHWADFTRRVAAELRGKVRFIEIWNEPDHPGFADFSHEEYLQLLNIGYENIKKAAPEIKVVTGGLSGLVSREQQDLFKMIIEKGKFDIPAFHGHGSLGGYRPQVRNLNAMTKAPWYANETALSAIHVGELTQAAALFQKFLYSWARGAMGFNWYDLRNDGADPKNNEHNFGLITHDFQPKAAYPVYNMLANVYKNGEFVRDLNLGTGLEGYLFRAGNGALLLAYWNNDASAGSRTIILSGVSGKVSHIDLFGNSADLKVSQGKVALEVGSLPGTLVFGGMRRMPEVGGELITLADPILITPGERKNVKLLVHNPTGQTLSFALNVKCPDGLESAGISEKFKLKPAEKKEVSFEITASPDFRSPDQQPELIAVNAKAGNFWTGTLEFPVRNAVVLPPRGFSQTPNFILDNALQLTALARNAPDKAHLFWTGPEDLSAKIWLGRSGENFIVKAEVTDDIHHQPHTGAMTWAGDNIQMALQLPGQSSIWEIGLTHLADGRAEAHIWMAPSGFDAARSADMIDLKTARNNDTKITSYEARIPFAAIGMTDRIGRRGFRFNLIINDNDGEMRESYIGIAPGIGENKTPMLYPSVLFNK